MNIEDTGLISIIYSKGLYVRKPFQTTNKMIKYNLIQKLPVAGVVMFLEVLAFSLYLVEHFSQMFQARCYAGSTCVYFLPNHPP